MDWHLRLSDAPLHAVQLLDGMLCAWTARDIVYFYGQDDGAYYDGLDVSNAPDDPRSAAWRDYLEGLRAPNGAYLPLVDLGHTVILTSNDGRLHLYERDQQQLILDVDGQQTVLERDGGASLVSAGLDRELGTIGALDDDNTLHFYQQHLYLGAYPVEQGARKILVPDESGFVVVVGEQQIQRFDTAGHVQHTTETTNPAWASACAPDGSRIVTADQEQGFLRVYNARLRLVRQQSAYVLFEQSTPLDDSAENVSPYPEAIAVSNTGRLGFASGGLVCCTHINHMPALPRPTKLF